MSALEVTVASGEVTSVAGRLPSMRYAIAFDLNIDALKQHYHNQSYNNAYGDVAKFLEKRGFLRQQGSLYFATEGGSAVDAVVAVQALTLAYRWIAPAVTDIRLLRVEDDNDLTPAIEAALTHASDPAKN